METYAFGGAKPNTKHAQALVYGLLCLMPTVYQQASLNAVFGRFLEAQGQPLPRRRPVKSGSSLSRFLNHYSWSTLGVLRGKGHPTVVQLACKRLATVPTQLSQGRTVLVLAPASPGNQRS